MINKRHEEEPQPVQQYYDAGFSSGYRLYAEHPGFDERQVATLANQQYSCEQKLIPLTKFSWYKDGFIAGYRQAESEAKK